LRARSFWAAAYSHFLSKALPFKRFLSEPRCISLISSASTQQQDSLAMRVLLAALAAAAVLGGSASAQQTGSPSAPMNQSPGVSTPDNSSRNDSGNSAVDMKRAGSPETTGAVEAGANSFTEGQARSRMEAKGFTNIQDLAKDEQGIWRGHATQNGRSVEVMLDYRGNIATR
jgi:periplasmic protein CpxP/Spy